MIKTNKPVIHFILNASVRLNYHYFNSKYLVTYTHTHTHTEATHTHTDPFLINDGRLVQPFLSLLLHWLGKDKEGELKVVVIKILADKLECFFFFSSRSEMK